MHQVVERDNGQSGVIYSIYLEPLLNFIGGRTVAALLLAGWLVLRHTVGEPLIFLVLLRPADERHRDLSVRAHHAAQRLGCQHPIGELLSRLSWRDEALCCLGVVFIEWLEAVEEPQIEVGRLGAIVDEEGWVLSPLAHVEGTEVQRALLATSLLEDD